MYLFLISTWLLNCQVPSPWKKKTKRLCLPFRFGNTIHSFIQWNRLVCRFELVFSWRHVLFLTPTKKEASCIMRVCLYIKFFLTQCLWPTYEPPKLPALNQLTPILALNLFQRRLHPFEASSLYTMPKPAVRRTSGRHLPGSERVKGKGEETPLNGQSGVGKLKGVSLHRSCVQQLNRNHHDQPQQSPYLILPRKTIFIQSVQKLLALNVLQTALFFFGERL